MHPFVRLLGQSGEADKHYGVRRVYLKDYVNNQRLSGKSQESTTANAWNGTKGCWLQ